MLSLEVSRETFGFAIGAFLLICLIGCAGRAFFSDFECSQKYNKSRIRRLIEALCNVSCLMFLPLWIMDLFQTDPAAASGIRFSVALVVIAAVFVGGFLLTVFMARRGWQGEPSDTVNDLVISTLPVAKCTNWPLTAAILLAAASGIGAYAGGGGTVGGYAVALGLNPLLWLAYYYFEMIGAQRCPHCRRLIGNHYREKPIGTPIWCGFCSHYSQKG